MLKTIAFQAKKNSKKSKILIFAKLLHIIRDGSEMVPECVLGPEASQKASGVTSEEQVLKKSFKYFDLNNNGTVEPDEFAKAIEKIGIMIPTKQVSAFYSL